MAESKNNLQEARTEKHLTRAQLAELVGVSWETIKAYEAKGATPSLQVALKIAHALDSTVEGLFGKIVDLAEIQHAVEITEGAIEATPAE